MEETSENRPDRGRAGRSSAVLGAALATVCALLLAHQFILNWQFRDLERQASNALDLYAVELGLTLAQYENAAPLIAGHPDVIDYLTAAPALRVPGPLNRLLERINAEIGASDTYVMDASGMTLAASNWNAERPFVGRSFAYRPYFQDAIEGGHGRFFGLGTTSGRRGHYFSAPVRNGLGIIVGVVAVKVLSAPLEEAWDSPGRLIVTDTFGVVFLSSDPAWLYGTVGALDVDQRRVLSLTRRYDMDRVRPLPIVVEGGRVRPAGDADAILGDEHLMARRSLPVMAADAAVLLPTAPARTRTLLLTLLVALALAGLWFLGFALVQRRSNLMQRRRFEEERRRQLETWAEELETRVMDRTAELTAANEALSLEMTERERTARRLRETQSDLIQAEKLAALGKISAGINHELNQPIGAVRAYADNARQFLERGKLDRAAENLQEIADLCERMGKTVRELKIYSRKEAVTVEPVGLRQALAAALRVVRHSLADRGITVDGLDGLPDIDVLAVETGLTQVLTNLLSNAGDAMSETGGDRRVTLSLHHPEADMAELILNDTGPGIPDGILPRLFDPFFTTKTGEKGLGLGLAISRNVVRGFDGDLTAENRAEGGARFRLRLRLARPLASVAE